jgi:hypothetical protein
MGFPFREEESSSQLQKEIGEVTALLDYYDRLVDELEHAEAENEKAKVFGAGAPWLHHRYNRSGSNAFRLPSIGSKNTCSEFHGACLSPFFVLWKR